MPAAPPLSKKTLLQLLGVLVSALAVFGVSVTVHDPNPDQPVPPTPAPSASPTPGNPFPPIDPCATPAGVTGLRNQDPEDEQRPWKRIPGQKAVVSIDKSKVAGNPEWVAYLDGAARKWNTASPCVDVRIVAGCPANAGCVTFDVVSKGDDGNFDERDRDGFNYGGKITVNSKLKGARLNPDLAGPCSERFNVVIHEIGHSTGLRHVTTRKAIMDPETYPDVCDIDPGAVDNLAYSYTRLQK